MRTLFLLAPLALLPGTLGFRPEAASSTQEDTASGKKLAALIERFNKADSESRAAYDKAATQGEKDEAYARRPGKEYISEFRAIAEEAKGTETGARAWLWVLKLLKNDPSESRRIVEQLLSDHMQCAALEELASIARNREVLRALVDESPHARVRAGALTVLGPMLLESKNELDKAEGRTCLEEVVAKYGELVSGNSTYGNVAERCLFELDHLQIGMVAPDFEATDENGAKWKLSDYRGKVVVVDFWGFW